MPARLTIATAQSHTQSSTAATLSALASTARAAARRNVDVLLFPEAYIGGYPRTCNFGASIGARDPIGREQFLACFQSAVDLGDTPAGAGDDWVDRKLPCAKGREVRGDGTRETLESIARETGVFLAVGAIEKAGGSLYCVVVYVCPRLGCVGKRRKVMPTGTERLIWGQGSPSTLRAVTTEIKGVKLTLAAAICWENYMPLLRQSLYSQNVNLYLAPTADGRDAWLSLMRTVACEGRCFVLSSNQCTRAKDLPEWLQKNANAVAQGSTTKYESKDYFTTPLQRRRTSVISRTNDGHEISWPLSPSAKTNGSGVEGGNGTISPLDSEETLAKLETFERHEIAISPRHASKPAAAAALSASAADGDAFLSRGGSCIISPLGEVLAGPMWETQEDGEGASLLVSTVDFEDCERGRLDLDVAGHYSRNDAFELTVRGLDLSPPPF